METKFLAIDADTPVTEARDRVRRARVARAVVLNENQRPIGIVGLGDLVRAAEGVEQLHARSAADVRYPVETSYHLERITPCVADVMSVLFPLPGSASVGRAAGLMNWETVTEVVVTDETGRAAGMVTSTDIVRWVAERAGFVTQTPDVITDFISPFLYEGPTDETERPRKILVVEDDFDICTGLVELLMDAGFDAVGAPDGREALELLRTMPTQPGLILLDLMMPRMNGWEFREQQLRDHRLRPIPVVVLTAHAKGLERDELRSPAAVLSKPIGARALLQTIQAHYQDQELN